MDLSALKIHGPKAMFTLLAMTVAPSIMQATLLTAVAPIAVTCNTATGPAAAVNFTLKATAAPAANTPLAITFGALSGGLTVTPVAATSLTSANNGAGIAFGVTTAAGCVGVSTGPQTIQVKQNGTNDIAITVNVTLTATTSALSVSPVTVSCTRTAGPTFTPAPAQTVSVTSAATGGTPFTIDTTTNAPPAWLVVGTASGASASASPVTFTVRAAAGCNNLAANASSTFAIHLTNAPAPDKLVTVTLQVVPPSPLTATPSPATLSYTKLSGYAGKVDVNITSSVPNAFFAVDTSSLPSWLTVDAVTGSAPKSLRFTSTGVADSLAPGTYTASVKVKVASFADLLVPVSILITNTAPKLTLSEGTTRNLNWVLGQPLPTPFITAVSSDSPIAYSVTTGGTLAPVVPVAQQKGLAYNFGTQIPVTFNPLVFAAAQPGNVLTGVVTITWGQPASTIVVTFNVSVVSPGATLSGIAPASLPTATSPQTFTVVVNGTGFVPSADPAQKTKVGVVVGNSIIADSNIAANVVNSSNIILTITVPNVTDQYLPFAPSGAGGNVTLGVCNPINGSCTNPTGTAVLSIGSNPIIQAVTNSAAFTQVTPPALQTIAPYDILSIFGTNFCSSGGTGCSSSQVLYGTADPVTLRYPATLSPDNAGLTQRNLSVTFQTHANSPAFIANAPLLFATNNQINLLVPAGLAAQIGNTVDAVVNFGYGTGATMKSSAPISLTVAATDPGLFTVGADGQGEGAILNASYAVVNVGNPAAMRTTGADSDYIQLYMTGLGVPDSTGDNATAGTNFAWDADCASVATYLASLNNLTGASLANLDGTVIQSAALNSNRLVPCSTQSGANSPTVTIGGQSVTVLYAGWVADTIAGLYQINVKLPASSGSFTLPSGATLNAMTGPVALPITVTSNGRSSQAGVTVWVAPKLKVVAPSTLSGTVGVTWSNSNNSVVASEGTSSYSYALTSGLLPAGLTLSASGGITGMPAAGTAGTYLVTVTATDSAPIPLTGSVDFTITIAGGLVITTNAGPFTGTFGTANASIVQATATGGVYPYFYTTTSPASLPTGMTINPTTGVIGISALTPAGTYHVTVHAIDFTNTVSGNATFDIVVGLKMVRTSPVAGANGAASTISTVTATGNTGTVSYALDATSAALSWLAIDSSTGAITVTTGAPASTVVNAVVTATDGTNAPNAASAGSGTIPVTITIN